jgi:hypothetical protein
VATDKQSYVDMPLNDGGSGALCVGVGVARAIAHVVVD